MSDAYAELAGHGGTASAVGSAFISLVEPHPGHERRYNRWYEDDHCYSTGAMAMPWWFAGRRWVATRDLRELRRPAQTAFADPVTAGCYLTAYWITQDHWKDQWSWLGTAVARLREEGRMFDDRTHVHTAFYDHRATVTRDPGGPRELHALDHPYAGVVLEVVDAEPGRSAELAQWLVGEHVPARLAASPAGQCVIFSPRPWPPGDFWFDNAETPEGRLLLLWFLEADPRDDWEALAAPADGVAASGLGRTAFLAPFVPTIPGTDRYVDELR
jgi:hypothetical protein